MIQVYDLGDELDEQIAWDLDYLDRLDEERYAEIDRRIAADEAEDAADEAEATAARRRS